MAKLTFAAEAKVEIKKAASYYEGCKDGLGKAFLQELESAINSISESPTRWRTIKVNFRRCLLKKFPYGIIYKIDEDEIFVAAIMHLKRKPDYWHKRIK